MADPDPAMLVKKTTEYTECQSSKLGPPHPLTRRSVASPPPLGPKDETLACGGGGGGTQFRRWDRHSGTLGILESLYG